MNMWIEVLGILAGVMFYGSMLLKGTVRIKIIVLVACVMFGAYGVLNWLPAIMLVNGFGLVVTTAGLVRSVRAGRRSDGYCMFEEECVDCGEGKDAWAGKGEDNICGYCACYHAVDSGWGWCKLMPEFKWVAWCRDRCRQYRGRK